MTEKDYILIDNYLKGTLSETEMELVLERLKVDADFSKQFKLEAELFETLNDEEWSFVSEKSPEVEEYKLLLNEGGMQDLKHTIDKVSKQKDNTTRKLNKSFFYYLAAASIVVFLGFQLFFNQSVSGKALYNDYVSLSELPSFATRSNANEIEKQLVNAQILFEKKNYKESLAIFESVLGTESSNISLYLYTGLAQVELNQFKKAEITYDNLINNPSIDGSMGYWYKALLYLKQDRLDDSKVVLNTVVSKKLYNYKKAEELLSQLNDE
ncbi:hypothetical protein [uncultured Psychroserpens sp.]|uniref:hypothetical protein n=1 Tax=uncultured Psychroserpens sp. TaxID=255436 RepID=UPI002624857F|nr:hypothetical protein [uncultured Psychroserpens sp.]